MQHLFFSSFLAEELLVNKKTPSAREGVFLLVSPTGLGTPASGSSSRRKVQTSHFAKRFAKLNARFHQLSAPNHMASCRAELVKQKNTLRKGRCFFVGEPDGIRTHDPLIKSQMLYRLSYEPSN